MRFERKRDVTAATREGAAVRGAPKQRKRERERGVAFRCTNFSQALPL